MAALIRRKPDPDNDRDEIPPGTLYLLILKTLAVRGRLHGYEIAESIQSCSDEVLQVEEGSLYPALQRMLIKGWVTGRVGRNRRQPPRPLLHSDARWREAAWHRSIAVPARHGRHFPNHPDGLRRRR